MINIRLIYKMRTLLQRIVIYCKNIQNLRHIQRKYYTRAITGDHVTQLNEETLTGRLLNYLIINKIQSVKMDKTREILDILNKRDTKVLQKCNTEQLMSCLTVISNRDLFNNRYEFLNMLNMLDTEFCRRLCQLEPKDVLKILHRYMKIIPHRIVEYKYYYEAVEELYKQSKTLAKSDLIQLIFYIGLQKKAAKSMYMLKKCITIVTDKFIDDLTTEELCIICNSTFKTSTKIDSLPFLNKVNNYLKDNLYLLKDPALFVTLIKTIRHNRSQTDDLLSTISCTIFFNKTLKYYSFPELCHILALYSDFLFYDETLVKAFTEKCIEQLKVIEYTSKHADFRKQPRLKDIKRFLWCLSNLNYKHLEVNDIKNIIIPNIQKILEIQGLEDNYPTLIEIILYLWMLNYRAYEFIPHALAKEIVQMIDSNSPTRRRLNLLLSTIYFEDPKLYKGREINLHPPGTEYDIKFQLEKRVVLQRVLDNLKLISLQHEINKYEYSCQVPYLNIVGITGYQKKIYKSVHIEVLDDYTSMKNTDMTPSGLMQLKLRILERLDEALIVIQADEVDLMSNEELQDFLLDELDLTILPQKNINH